MSDTPELKVVEGGAQEVEQVETSQISDEELEQFYEENKIAIDLMGGLDTLEALLETPDEGFVTLEPMILATFAETLQEKQTQEEILTMLGTQEYDPIEIQKEVNTVLAAIETMDFLSKPKQDFLKRVVSMSTNTLQTLANKAVKYIQIPCELDEGVELPTYAKEGDAGLDIYAREEITIAPGETKIIDTGIKVAIPEGYALLIQPRSGQSAKTKLRVANTPGLIDSGYRDSIGVIIENIEPPFKDIEYDFDDNGEIHIKSILHGESYTIAEGQRFAQMRLVQVPHATFMKVESVGEIGENRGGGFGHTGE